MCYHNQEGKDRLAKHGFAPYDVYAADADGYGVHVKDEHGYGIWRESQDAKGHWHYDPELEFHPWESDEQREDITWALAHPIDGYPFPVHPVPEELKRVHAI